MADVRGEVLVKMLSFRSFRNTDPPVVVDLWRSRMSQEGLMQPVSADLFEQLVFAKLYFDYRGLVIACDDGRPVGFAHAAFGPDEAGRAISARQGVTCVVVVRPDCDETAVAAGLLGQCEQYLRERGAEVLYGGGIAPLCPFYLGLYGGVELPGVLTTDHLARQLYASQKYGEVGQTVVLARELGNFEAPIDRRQMEIRRRMIVEVTVDPPSRTWWEACTLGEFELTRLDVVPRGGGPVVAHAIFRGLEPSGATAAGRAAGLVELHVAEAFRHRGLAVYLISEACRQFLRQGVTLVEAQTLQENRPALGLFQKLGFPQVGGGIVFRKTTGPL
jgi:GNAT superfamily N-acetyltransferase